MRKFLQSLLALAMITFSSILAQTDLPFFENFESTQVIPEGWTLVNVDGATPDDAELANMTDSAWIVTNSPVMGSHIAMGVSFYAPEAGADDWLILPPLALTANAVLSWDALSLTSSGNYPDSYQVLISTTDYELESFDTLITIENEAWREAAGGEGVQRRSIALGALGFGETNAIIAFRLMTPEPGGDRLGIDNIRVEELLEEGFEGGIPENWVVVNHGNNPGTFVSDNYDPHKGEKHVSLDAYDSAGPSEADDWLISPPVTVGEGFFVSVWAKSDDPDYPDNLSLVLSATDTAVASFTITLAEIDEVPNAYTKYSFRIDTLEGVTAGENIYVGLHCTSNGSWLYLDDFRVGEFIPPALSGVYATSDTTLTVEFDSEVSDIAAEGFLLTGSGVLLFETAEVDDEDGSVVHLSGISGAMTPDNLLDTLAYAPLVTSYAFYGGVLPLAYGNLVNPEGTIDFDDHTATWKGIVTAIDSYDSSRVWIQDGPGAFTGLNTYDLAGGEVNVGDEILVTGKLSPFKNLAELYPSRLISVLSTGNTPQVYEITGSDIPLDNAADAEPAEMYEAALVKIENATADAFDGVYFSCTDDGGETFFYVGDGIDLLYEFGDDLTDLMETGKTYSVTGIVVGRDGEYRLVPRSVEDISLVTSADPFEKSGIRVYPNPADNRLFLTNLTGIETIELTGVDGRVIRQMHTSGLEKLTLDVSQVPSGIYLLKLRSAQGKPVVARVVIR